MKNSVKVSVCGIMTALGIALLFFSSIFPFSTYVMPIVAGLIMIILIENFNKKIAFTVFVATSLLSVFLVAERECSFIYIAFFGYYPICQDSFNKIKSKILRVLLKYALFNISMIAVQLLLVYVFLIPFDDFLGKWGIVILLLLANAIFFFYEYLLKTLRIIYLRKYKKRFSKIFKR